MPSFTLITGNIAEIFPVPFPADKYVPSDVITLSTSNSSETSASNLPSLHAKSPILSIEM